VTSDVTGREAGTAFYACNLAFAVHGDGSPPTSPTNVTKP
jgi:hypothetical protein